MATILIPRKHLRQPQGRVTIAPEWMQRSPVAVWMPSAPGHESVAGGVYPYTGSTVQPTHIGVAYKHAARVLPGANFPKISGEEPFTILAFVNTGTARASIYTQRVGGWNNEIALRVNDSGANSIAVINARTNAGGGSVFTHAPGALFDGRWQLIAFVSDAAGYRVYADGAELLSTAAIHTGALASTAAIGGLPDSTGIPYLESLGLLATFQSALTGPQISDLSVAPWQMFRADPIRIYSFPSGSLSINSITASNITQTGARITLGVTR